MGKAKKIIFITRWYPNRYDNMIGLFVKKHAQAVSLFANVAVVYLHIDSKVERMELVQKSEANMSEYIVYIPKKGKIANIINYFRYFFSTYNLLKKEFGKPDIAQVNVLTRCGILAYILNLKEKIPYFVIEHWTRYLPQNFSYKGFIRKRITELVAKNASAIMPVSELLADAMQKHNIKNPNYKIVSNVVDDIFFENIELNKEKEKKIILNVSCFLDRQKGLSPLLHAVERLSKRRDDFELVMIGDGEDFERIKNLANELHIANYVKFTGELSPCEVAKWFKQSSFFVLFSNFETSGVVFLESLASGRAVIGTNTGIVPEAIDQSNGFVVEIGDENALLQKMEYLLDNYHCYDAQSISQKAKQKYSFESVGKQLIEIYEKAAKA